jgi:hypothetical protein
MRMAHARAIARTGRAALAVQLAPPLQSDELTVLLRHFLGVGRVHSTLGLDKLGQPRRSEPSVAVFEYM